MKATYKVNDKLTLELEWSNQKDLFEKLASIDEIFGYSTCPLVDKGGFSKNLKFVVREIDGNKYYEIQCKDPPYAKLSFGQHRQSKTLFPKKQEGGKYWHVYSKEE